MKMTLIVLVVTAILLVVTPVKAETGFTASLSDQVGFTKLVNEISFYQNTDSDFDGMGRTLQVISINSFKLFTTFNLEFTGDFNWELDLYEDYDYYIELSLVKPINSFISFNYQQVHGTFLNSTVHQFGVRLSL